MLQFVEISKPKQNHTLSPQQMFLEKRTDTQILDNMDEDTYEELVSTWAYFCLKKKYQHTHRIGGAGDKGVDILAIKSMETRECDIYQCKHYQHSIAASVVLPEICKILYFIYIGELNMPNNYYMVAPKSLNPSLLKIYQNPNELKNKIISEWNRHSSKITSTSKIELTESLRNFIECFDFYKFQIISPDYFISSLRENIHVYNQYFGIHREDIKRIPIPTPDKISSKEAIYIQNLLDAYNEKRPCILTSESVLTSEYQKHFKRARDTFWLAESVRKISEDNSPGDSDEFAELKSDMFFQVADVYDEPHDSGLDKNREVLSEAKKFIPKTDRIISGEISAGEKVGVCYHLSNDNILKWVQK